MGYINLLMDENKCKIDPTNSMKFIIVASLIGAIELSKSFFLLTSANF
jgi:hypothetical protein